MKILIALAIMLSLNVFLFMGNQAVHDINGGSTSLINFQNDTIGQFATFDGTRYILNEDIKSKLPAGNTGIAPDTGSFFTDTWSTITSWIGQTTGLSYVWGIVNAVPNFLKRFLDPTLAFIIGFFWHAMTIFLIIQFIKGDG